MLSELSWKISSKTIKNIVQFYFTFFLSAELFFCVYTSQITAILPFFSFWIKLYMLFHQSFALEDNDFNSNRQFVVL